MTTTNDTTNDTTKNVRLDAVEARVRALEQRVELATKPVLSMTEAAALLGISRVTIYERIKPSAEFPLPTRLWGKRRVVLRADLDTWLASLHKP